ncbi:MAG: DUF533 domain-containing protein, partial [Pseudomonadota bacterium]
EKILEHLGEMDAAEVEFVRAELSSPVDVAGLAAETSQAMASQVYAVSLMAIKVDDVSEVQYLGALADALGLSADARNQVHRSMGLG